MLNYLKGCTEQTQIGMLPDIITHNNKAIKNEFEYIYDSSLNRLTKSVYAPTGSVKAHFGEFVNLAVEYISIKNLDSLSETIQQAVANEHHNVVKGRFDSSMSEIQFANTNYCHNASIIAYDASYNVYQQIRHTVKWVTDLSVYVDTSVTKIIDDMQEKVDNVEADTLDLSIYVHSIESQIDDISNAAWSARRDTDDLSVYVHSIESKIDDISAKAQTAYDYAYDLSVYVHSIEHKINDISIKAQTAYDYAYDLSVYVHNASLLDISDVSKVAHDASAKAQSAYDIALNNTTVISKLSADVNVSIAAINTSINSIEYDLVNTRTDVKALQLDMTDVQGNIQILNTSVNNVSNNVDILNTSVNNISINIDEMQVQVNDISTQINNIKTANFQITYNSSTYELSDIVQLLDWKNSIYTETITVQSGGQPKTLSVLCVNNMSSIVTACNARLNQLTGETSLIDNPEDYTQQDIDDAANQMNNLL